MTIKCSYTPVNDIGTCIECGEQNLSTKYGDQLIAAGPVCYICHVKLTATERSEGARTSEARQQNHHA